MTIGYFAKLFFLMTILLECFIEIADARDSESVYLVGAYCDDRSADRSAPERLEFEPDIAQKILAEVKLAKNAVFNFHADQRRYKGSSFVMEGERVLVGRYEDADGGQGFFALAIAKEMRTSARLDQLVLNDCLRMRRFIPFIYKEMSGTENFMQNVKGVLRVISAPMQKAPEPVTGLSGTLGIRG